MGHRIGRWRLPIGCHIVTMSPCAAVRRQFLIQGFSLLLAVFQKRLALPSDSWAFCYLRHRLNTLFWDTFFPSIIFTKCLPS